MKKSVLISSLSVVAITLLSAFDIVNSNGYSGGTGAPADGGVAGSCAGCHSGGASVPVVTISSVPALAAGNKYTPGTTYTFSILGSGYTKYGFDFEILNSQSSTPTSVNDFGTFGPAPSGEAKNNPIPSYPYTDIMHTTPRATAFTVVWTAPASGTGYLYCAVLGANMNGATSGDKVSLNSMTLTPAVASGIAKTDAENNALNLSIYPNPCTEKINLSYQLATSATVKADLFNISGSKVAEIFNSKQEPGSQEINFIIPSEMPKGNYFLKMEINDKIITKKIMIK
ncbi:MAG: choice-of-anchor V domain-containing protein [Bacteroidia bacterium]